VPDDTTGLRPVPEREDGSSARLAAALAVERSTRHIRGDELTRAALPGGEDTALACLQRQAILLAATAKDPT
jgi:hypothetical protein